MVRLSVFPSSIIRLDTLFCEPAAKDKNMTKNKKSRFELYIIYDLKLFQVSKIKQNFRKIRINSLFFEFYQGVFCIEKILILNISVKPIVFKSNQKYKNVCIFVHFANSTLQNEFFYIILYSIYHHPWKVFTKRINIWFNMSNHLSEDF